MPEFLLYETFRDAAEATAVAGVLTGAGIPHELEDESNLLSDLAYPMDRVNAQIRLRLRGADFLRANEALRNYYRSLIPETDPEYMLYSFSDGELRDVIYKPEEWGEFNVVLAEHILNGRGAPINEARASGEQRQRIEQLRKPEHLSGLWLFIGYLSAVAGGFLGIITGLYLLRGKKTLPNGERVLTYEKSDRRQGLIMLIISCVVLLAVAIGYFCSGTDTSYIDQSPYNPRWRMW